MSVAKFRQGAATRIRCSDLDFVNYFAHWISPKSKVQRFPLRTLFTPHFLMDNLREPN